eukprot:940064-Rhodomonas_salina.2
MHPAGCISRWQSQMHPPGNSWLPATTAAQAWIAATTTRLHRVVGSSGRDPICRDPIFVACPTAWDIQQDRHMSYSLR